MQEILFCDAIDMFKKEFIKEKAFYFKWIGQTSEC